MTDWAALATKLDTEDTATRARLEHPDALTNAALWYGTKGIRVFPLVPGEKRPLTTHGLKDATNDAAQIAVWWRRWPQANIGFRTGLLFDVIDVDGPAGYLSLAALRDEGLIPDVIGRTTTPRGAHLYICPTGDGNTAGLRAGIDVRGNGGYVVAPPSLSAATGRRWTWTTPLNFDALIAKAA